MTDERIITLDCADCGAKIELKSSTINGAFAAAKLRNWAISDKRDKMYCPECAENHRHVGRGGARRNVQTRINLG